jgi:DNA polymerase type B, organellar and viral
MFKIDFTKYPTLPALAFAIYRSKYMPKNTIPKILGSHHYTLKKAYYGGITEAYKPYGRSIKSYDVNSLYPSVMHDCEMPVGIPTYFLGDISYTRCITITNIPYGLFRVKVKAPLDIKCPPLPFKFKTREGKRTIFPVGE